MFTFPIGQARQLDPLSLIIATDRASIMYYSRQYDSAVKQCRSVLELDPNFDHALRLIVPFYFELGRYDDEIEGIHRWGTPRKKSVGMGGRRLRPFGRC
jgi:tetratricopeptide (TPR) repeat protein